MKAPWVFAWTSAISYNKSFFFEIGGFDEKILGWGGEDNDLGIRAYSQGATFTLKPESIAFHFPHERKKGFNLKKQENSLKNRMYLHKKYNQIETELYVFFNGTYVSTLLDCLENINFSSFNPLYNDDIIKDIPKGFNLSVGFDSIETVNKIQSEENLVVSNRTYKLFCEKLTGSKCKRWLGLITNYPNKWFNNVIISNFYKSYPSFLQEIFKKEMERIAKNTIYLDVYNYKPSLLSSNIIKDGFSDISIDEIYSEV